MITGIFLCCDTMQNVTVTNSGFKLESVWYHSHTSHRERKKAWQFTQYISLWRFLLQLLLIVCWIFHSGVLHLVVAIWNLMLNNLFVRITYLDGLVTSLWNIKMNYFSHVSSWFVDLHKASHISPCLLLSCQTKLAGPESSKIMTRREDVNISHFTPVTCPGSYFPFAIWNILQVGL